ncbi:hypothetical protein RQP46_011239 [Phenoliferia psychrophenolica]
MTLTTGGAPDYEQHPRIPPHDAVPEDVDTVAAVAGWLAQANAALTAGSGELFAELFHDEGWWKDKHAFTWTYRSLFGKIKITRAFEATYEATKAHSMVLDSSVPPAVARPQDDLSFIQAHLRFETKVVVGSSIVNLVLREGKWTAWTLSTVLEELKDFLEIPRPYGSSHQLYYEDRRAAALNFDGQEPSVMILGAGQTGLSLAAQLQALGVPTLLIDKNPRVGDAWRNRYEALSLHSPCHSDSLPFIPFPKHWPMYPGPAKLCQFLEAYAGILDLNIWNSTTLTTASFDDAKGEWTVVVQQKGLPARTLHPKHLVVATGTSTEYRNAKEFKVSTSEKNASTGMDIAADLGEPVSRSPTYVMSLSNGLPLNGSAIYNENGPPIEVADRIVASMPYAVVKLLNRQVVARVAEQDREMLDGLKKGGFKTWLGPEDAGHLLLGLGRAGGYYFDSGASALIANGKIKVTQGRIKNFTSSGLALQDGTLHDFDAVVFATGFTTVRDAISKSAIGPEVANKIGDCWGLTSEHEILNTFVPLAHPNIYYCFCKARIDPWKSSTRLTF